MGTRFYFPRSGTVPATPAFGSGWEVTTSADRFPLSTSNDHDASNSTTGLAETSTSVIDRLHRQYVSDGTLYDGQIAGTFTLVLQGYESSSGADHYLQCIIRIVSGDGSVERGVLYAGQTPTTPDSDPAAPNGEFSTAPVQTRVISTVALTAVTAQAGDRLVVELGYRACNTTGTSTTAFLRLGAVSSQSDFAATAGTTTDGRPWIEFSEDIFAVKPPTATATAAFPEPSILVGEDVPAALVEAAFPAPAVFTDMTVAAPAATATAQALAPDLVIPQPRFTPPTILEGSNDPFFGRYLLPVGMSVVRMSGTFQTVRFPWLGDLAGLTDGVDYFLGGHEYEVSNATAAELVAAGYTVS